MKKFTSTVAFLTILSMLLASAGCGKTDDTETTGGVETSAPGTAETETEAEPTVPDTLEGVIASLPDADYEGYSFHTWLKNDLNAVLPMRQAPEEGITGEPVNDALWERDRAIEKKYNVKVTYTVPDAAANLYDEASKVIMSGDHVMDLVYTMVACESPSFVNNGLVYSMTDVPHVDLSQPHWSQHNKDMEIGGKLMYATGDLTTRYAAASFLMMFNQQQFTNNGFEFPYEDAREGKWTFDKMYSMAKDQYKDLNGNGTRDIDDFYGVAHYENCSLAYYVGFGKTGIELDEEDKPVIACGGEAEIKAMETIGQLLQSPDAWVTWTVYQEGDIFRAGHALFTAQCASGLSMFSEMEEDFGVLPMPKEDEKQEQYATNVNPWCATAIMVPKTVEDLDRAGFLTEALAAASRVSSMRAQYEQTLLYRQTRDEDSVEMLRLATETSVYELSDIFGWGGLSGIMSQVIDHGEPIASKLEALRTSVPAAVEATIAGMNAGMPAPSEEEAEQ